MFHQDGDGVIMAQAKYYNFGIFLITGISGSIFSMAFSMLIAKLKLIRFRKVLNYIGQNTLTIFVTHQFFLTIVKDILSKININASNYIAVIVIKIISIHYITAIIITTISIIGGLAIDKIIKLDIWRKEKVNT